MKNNNHLPNLYSRKYVLKVIDTKRKLNQIVYNKIVGTIIHTIFYDAKDGYTIAKFQYSGVKGLYAKITGFYLPHPVGEILEVEGIWNTHPKHGRHLQVDNYQVLVPATRHAIYEYLCSRVFQGIGHNLVRRILDKFGDKAFDVILKDIERLKEVGGVGEKAIQNIKNGLDKRKYIRKVPKVIHKALTKKDLEHRIPIP
jgi:exodeoxyribonuclease V alpha subunit